MSECGCVQCVCVCSVCVCVCVCVCEMTIGEVSYSKSRVAGPLESSSVYEALCLHISCCRISEFILVLCIYILVSLKRREREQVF